MIESLRYPDEPYTQQVNVRMRLSTRANVYRLARINGETIQGLFDRLVGEEYERDVVKNAGARVSENESAIAAIQAETDEIHVIVAASKTLR